MYCNSIKLKHKDKMFSSYDIPRFSDVVYSEAISYPQFKKLKLNNPIILGKDIDIVFYKLREFTIKRNDIIFTHTGNLDKLKIDYWKNIVIRSKELSPADKHVEKRIIESNFVTKYFKYKIFIKSWLKSKLKILLFYYEKIKSKLI